MNIDDKSGHAPLFEHRQLIAAYGADLFRACHIEFAKTSELQRQVTGAFMFGITFAHGQIHKMPPADVHTLAVSMLMSVLRYSAEQAGDFSSRLIEATGAGPENTTNAIIHRGIDGHLQLTSGEFGLLRQNLLGIFQTLGQPYSG